MCGGGKKRNRRQRKTELLYLFMFSCLIAALGLWLDCVSCAFVACVCFSFIMMSQESTTSSNVGLAISQALILTGMVQYGIRQMMESFQLFTNTERVLQYTKLEQEPLISRKPTRDWPFKGKRYNDSNSICFTLFFSFFLFDSSRTDWIQEHVTVLRHQRSSRTEKFEYDHRAGNESWNCWKVRWFWFDHCQWSSKNQTIKDMKNFLF